MHGAHGARQHGAVAHAGVEQPQRRRARMDVGQLHADALGDDPLLAAGGDEQQVFLPVVVEAEVVPVVSVADAARGCRGAAGAPVHLSSLRRAGDEGAHPVHRVRRHAAAQSEPARPACRHSLPAGQRSTPPCASGGRTRRCPVAALRSTDDLPDRYYPEVRRRPSLSSTTILPTRIVGRKVGKSLDRGHRCPNPRAGRRHIQIPHACLMQRVEDRVHHRRQRADRPRLAAALGAQRIAARSARGCCRPPHAHVVSARGIA